MLKLIAIAGAVGGFYYYLTNAGLGHEGTQAAQVLTVSAAFIGLVILGLLRDA